MSLKLPIKRATSKTRDFEPAILKSPINRHNFKKLSILLGSKNKQFNLPGIVHVTLKHETEDVFL